MAPTADIHEHHSVLSARGQAWYGYSRLVGHNGYQHGISLLAGWLPLTVEVMAIVLGMIVLARRSRRWWLVWIPVAAAVGGLSVWLTYRYWTSAGLSSDPPPATLWWWIGATVAMLVVAVVGAARTQWWRRAASVLAVALTMLATGITINQWVGYFPTVQEAWAQMTAGPLPDQVDPSTLASLRIPTPPPSQAATTHAATTAASTSAITPMQTGKVVSLTTDSSISHFAHRTEYVYLPPAWFVGRTPPQLPVLMMISGEFNTPADWLRTGNAISTIDAFARAHGGNAPILVFPDVGGSFNNDTECVNGPRGNVADHLTDEVRPAVISQFHASASAANWGVVGWSMGGTCAVDLVTMHPDTFTTFEDIAGDAAPSSGNKAQTISRLFGGNAAAYAAFDPATAMARHGRYSGVHGWFAEATGSRRAHPGHRGGAGHHWSPHGVGGNGLGGRDGTHLPPGSEVAAAAQLCSDAQRVGIDCTIHDRPDGHTWQFASTAFADALATLAHDIEVPGVDAPTTGRT